MNDRQLPVPGGIAPPVRGSTYPAAIIDGEPRFPEGARTRALASPIDGAPLGIQQLADEALVSEAVARAQDAFLEWRLVPAPRRGELVRRIGEAVRANKRELARIVTLEAGKIVAEAEGEVQEWIDICDFAVGLSRQLQGFTIASERPEHRMMEQWLPLGPVGVITAFNFPVAVWAWNAMLALVCGDSVIWKPSEKTPLCALAVQTLVGQAIAGMEDAPAGIVQLVVGEAEAGEALARDTRVPLVSATGSVRMGKRVGATVGARLGRSLLELGGNNAMIVSPSARIELALPAIVFAAAGTAGQRCTSLRRLIVHESVLPELRQRLVKAFESLPIGDPRTPGTLVGPLIDPAAFAAMQAALDEAGRRLLCRTGDRGSHRQSARRMQGNLRPDPVPDAVSGTLRGDCTQQRCAARPVVGDLHRAHAGSRTFSLGRGVRLRHREREHRHFRRRDRWRIRRREGHRRRARIGLGCLEGLHAPRNEHDQLRRCAAARAGHPLRHLTVSSQASPVETGSAAAKCGRFLSPFDADRGRAGGRTIY